MNFFSGYFHPLPPLGKDTPPDIIKRGRVVRGLYRFLTQPRRLLMYYIIYLVFITPPLGLPDRILIEMPDWQVLSCIDHKKLIIGYQSTL